MKFHSTIVQVYLYGNWPVGSIKYFGFIFKIDFSQRLVSWRIDTFRICYASRIFFIFVFVVLSRCICLFVVIRIVKIQDLQLLFITSNKAFMEILLGQKFFPNISSWSFLKKRICIISADLCNPCIIMYEILYITLLWYVLQLLYFICCAQISKTITWAYFSNYLSNYQETNCYFIRS